MDHFSQHEACYCCTVFDFYLLLDIIIIIIANNMCAVHIHLVQFIKELGQMWI